MHRPRKLAYAALNVLALVVGMAAPASRAQAPAPEQGYLVQVWQTEHGLPENIVNAIAQTPDGYLWCGTTHGLARFDGMEFKVFNGLNSPPLGSARIRQLFVDRAGTLWIAVFEGGLIRYFNGQFTAYSLPPRESTARTIFWMAEDESGGLWVTVEDGAVFHFSDGKFRQVSKNWDGGFRRAGGCGVGKMASGLPTRGRGCRRIGWWNVVLRTTSAGYGWGRWAGEYSVTAPTNQCGN